MYWFAFGSCLTAIASAIYARQTVKKSKEGLTYHHLTKLMEDYEQPEMRKEVKKLWKDKLGYESNDLNIAIEYAKCLKSPDGLSNENVDKRCRKVSFFYQRMAALYEGGLLPGNVLYRIWAKEDLKIIPDIIIPLEKELYKNLNEGKDPPEHHYDHLEKLYRDSLKY